VILLLAAFSLVWLALALPLYSHPDFDGLLATLHGAPGLLLLAPTWLVTATILVSWTILHGLPRAPIRLAAVALITPACGLLGVALAVTDLDMHLRFRLSEAHLTREAERVRNLPEGRDATERRVGLFRVHDAYHDERGDLRLVTNYTHLFGEAGFIHAVADPPAPDPGLVEHITPLRGPWHAYFIVD
jgi:hypothetical protein